MKSKKKIRFGLRVLWLMALLFTAFITPNDPYKVDVGNSFKSPSVDFLGGTDRMGRCILSRSSIGVRHTLYHAGVAEIIALLISILTASVVTAFHFKFAFIAKMLNVFLLSLRMIPPFLLGLLAAVFFRGTDWGIIFPLVILSFIYSEFIYESELKDAIKMPQIESAVSLGASKWWILSRYLVPAVFPRILRYAVLDFASLVAFESLFGFVGITFPPVPSLGAMIYEARPYIMDYPWMFWIPTMMLALILSGGWKITIDKKDWS